MLKCPKCNEKMIEFEMVAEKEITLICNHCHYQTSDKQEIQNIKDCAMIEEDMKIWRKAQKYR